MNFRAKGRRRPEASLDMTPLIDVVFLLLIFFLITTTFSRPTQSQTAQDQATAAIEVNMPKAATGDAVEESDRMTVFLQKDGTVRITNGDELDAAQLKKKLLDLQEQGETPDSIDLRADKGVPYGDVIELLDLIKGTGIEKVNIVIEKKAAPSE